MGHRPLAFHVGVIPPATAPAILFRRVQREGHVAAVLGLRRRLGLERLLHRNRSRLRDLALAAIVARVL